MEGVMRSTGRWVAVESDGKTSFRMLHVDTKGRPVVRLDREWWLVSGRMTALGRCGRYFLDRKL
jgi:hypothetical protein